MTARYDQLQQYKDWQRLQSLKDKESIAFWSAPIAMTLDGPFVTIDKLKLTSGCESNPHIATGIYTIGSRGVSIWDNQTGTQKVLPQPMTLARAVETLNRHKYLGFDDWVSGLTVKDFSVAPVCKTSVPFPLNFEWVYFKTEFEAICIAEHLEKLERESK